MYLNYYNHEGWHSIKVEKHKKRDALISLGKRKLEYKMNGMWNSKGKPKSRGGRNPTILSFRLGEPPFFVIVKNQIFVDPIVNPLVLDEREIVAARACENGLALILKSTPSWNAKFYFQFLKLTKSGMETSEESELKFSNFRGLFPFQSFNPELFNTPRHSFSDISSQNQPIGSSECGADDYVLHELTCRGELISDTHLDEEGYLRIKRNKLYTLNWFEKGQITVVRKLDGRGLLSHRKIFFGGYSVWLSEKRKNESITENKIISHD